MKLQPKPRRVQRYLARLQRAPAFRWRGISDPRARRGRRWQLRPLLDALLLGMLCAAKGLRDVEQLTDEADGLGRRLVPRRVPDTTLYELVPRLDIEELRDELRRRVRHHERAKRLRPVGLPCGVLAVDGKGIGVSAHDNDGTAQKAHRAHDGSPYWLPRFLRAVLTSAPSRPCLDQMAVPPETNEVGAVYDFLTALVAAYGRTDLFKIVTLDAGFACKAVADAVVAAERAYVIGLKGNQPELRREAERQLRPQLARPAEAQTGWERRHGCLVRRRLWRNFEMAGWNGWEHLRQVWLVRQETQRPDGRLEVEDRYFLTSLWPGRLKPQQILLLVRGHWGIENNCFNSLDQQWLEDAQLWCRQGRAVEVLGLVRVMAYNEVQMLRSRHLLERRHDGRPAIPHGWRSVLRWVAAAVRLPLEKTPTTAVG